jgi:hypothetical protein
LSTHLTFVLDPEQSTGTTLALGAGAPQLGLGELGWTEVDRPKQVGFVAWEGSKPRTQTIPLLFDRLPSKRTVQPEIDALEAIARPGAGRPSPVTISGPSLHHTELTWVITSLEFGDDAISFNGQVVQRSAVLVLTEFIEADVVISRTGKATQRKRTHRVKKGERISDIAKKYLGNSRRWPEIAALNKAKVKNPKSLKTGIVLTIPDR